MARLDWPPIIERAAEIVGEYGTAVTLRQLHYRLVAEGAYPNTDKSYKRLSALTAQRRRDGTFPDLADNTRGVHNVGLSFRSVDEAKRWLADQYRRDRTEGQEITILIAVEKDTLRPQVCSWFEEEDIPVFSLRGYASQTYVDDIAGWIGGDTVVLYVGDFDPSGEDIERDLRERAGLWDGELRRVAVTAQQVEDYGLPEMPGKTTDTRAGRFTAEHGKLVQVEAEALDPGDLQSLLEDAVAEHWDESAFRAVLELEERERQQLAEGT